jgi:myosin-crossreactive antigen
VISLAHFLSLQLNRNYADEITKCLFSPFQLLNHMNDFHEKWYEHHKAAFFKFLTATLADVQFVKWDSICDLRRFVRRNSKHMSLLRIGLFVCTCNYFKNPYTHT